MKKKPLILITNDDGITAPGLRSLIKVMNKIAKLLEYSDIYQVDKKFNVGDV